ncbi:PHD finger protein 1 isoform X2 [Eschrichtius robustus]|uniref:PHD finger protein 1 isoform X2 n=1 Tax=Eschrichtius robustus TaxID=9764 RepID=UPI0035C056AD
MAWGEGSAGGRRPGGGISSCPEGRSPFGGWGCGDSLSRRVRQSARPIRGEGAACSAPSRPVGGEGGGVRWGPPPYPPAPPSPQSSPPTTLPFPPLPFPSLPSPLLPSPPSPRRLLLLLLPLLWLLRHTPQSRRDGGAGPGDPPVSACTPPDAQTCPPRAGGSPRSPTSASARLPAAPAVTARPPQDAMAQPPRLSRSGAPPLWDPASPAPTSGPRPRLWEGQDVLARWTDGLLYLGTIKKVDSAREVCLVQFEDDSQFLVLWKDISPAALPGEELLCCVCRSETVVPGNRLVSCEKCRHAYHQDCHVPRAPAPGEGEGTSWVCRQCVFAIATKRGGALKKGPYARAMLGMKLSLPYGLKGLDWDAGHLSNRQQSYCYCGGPGEWNLKMLQCRSCLQWFHEACTQCLSKPLLYGDRFYEFECCVCQGGPEKVRRLQLRWVDVAHLVLYHLSVCCKKKYFDFDREILPFTSENWDSLLLGELSDTPKGERSSRLLSALNSHKDRFISGREIKKRKCLFGLHARIPPPVEPPTGDGAPTSFPSGQGPGGGVSRPLGKRRRPEPEPLRRRQKGKMEELGPPSAVRNQPEPQEQRERARLQRALQASVSPPPSSPNQSYQGSSGYNFRPTDARCLPSPIRMFASFHPSASTAGTSGDGEPPDRSPLELHIGFPTDLPKSAPHSMTASSSSVPAPSPGLPRRSAPPSPLCRSLSPGTGGGVRGGVGYLSRGDPVRVLARRVRPDGSVQYLVEWGGGGIF